MKVGLVGWRGMVGSVLMQRMQEEKDFDLIDTVFFSTSNAGGKAPSFAKTDAPLADANDIDALKQCDTIITCQGGDYAAEIFRSCAPPAGTAIGSTPLRRCAWKTTR